MVEELRALQLFFKKTTDPSKSRRALELSTQVMKIKTSVRVSNSLWKNYNATFQYKPVC